MEERLASRAPWAIFPRKRLETNGKCLRQGLSACLTCTESDRRGLEIALEREWAPYALSCLSVRTGFDLLLSVLALPKGSHILCSAVTIPDMVRIIERHGLVPVAIDLSVDTLRMDVDALQKSITPQAKMILFAHLFGAINPLHDVARIATQHDLLFVEDCAECYVGHRYHGYPQADVSMFSFGTIKTSTAFGGAMFRFKDRDLRDVVRQEHSKYPARPTSEYTKKLLKYSAVHSASNPAIYGLLVKGLQTFGVNHDDFITSLIRGFSSSSADPLVDADDYFFSLIRQKPEPPLLDLLRRRLSEHDENDAYMLARQQKCARVAEQLIEMDIAGVRLPGVDCERHSYWLFPVMVQRPQEVCDHMLAAGFDVTSGATQLKCITACMSPHLHPYTKDKPEQSEAMMEHIVYLPITPQMPNWALDKMLSTLEQAVLGFGGVLEDLHSRL